MPMVISVERSPPRIALGKSDSRRRVRWSSPHERRAREAHRIAVEQSETNAAFDQVLGRSRLVGRPQARRSTSWRFAGSVAGTAMHATAGNEGHDATDPAGRPWAIERNGFRSTSEIASLAYRRTEFDSFPRSFSRVDSHRDRTE